MHNQQKKKKKKNIRDALNVTLVEIFILRVVYDSFYGSAISYLDKYHWPLQSFKSEILVDFDFIFLSDPMWLYLSY